MYKYYRYESPFSPQIIEDSRDPIRRELLLMSIQEELIEPENMDVLRVLDIFMNYYQRVNFKGKPHSVLGKPRRKRIQYEDVLINGEMVKIKVVQ